MSVLVHKSLLKKFSEPEAFLSMQGDNLKPEFSVVWSGRLGNLLFQYASLIGICSKLMKSYISISHDDVVSCLKISNPNYYTLDNPVSEFVKIFNLSASVGSFAVKNIYQEHAEDIFGTYYDEKVFQQLSGTEFQGIASKLHFKIILSICFKVIFNLGDISILSRRK